ncbi:MAG: hypothetical protein U0414_39620 [Polyangiaceae bacterium]
MKKHLLGLIGLLPLAAACSSPPESKFAPTTPPLQVKHFADGSVDDGSLCDWRNRKDREVLETAGPGAIIPNARRVFAVLGQGADRQRILVCREIDTNLDGTKDVVRKYNDKGESLFEQADSNYDGRIDTWLVFSKGHMSEAKFDKDYDGNPDEWDFYVGGHLSRVKRDTNRDGKPDRWEVYASNGQLERIGVDLDNDERVDRWDYDTDIRRARDEKNRKEDQEAVEKANKEAQSGEYNTADPSNMGSAGPEQPSEEEKKDEKKTPGKATPKKKVPPTDGKPADDGKTPPAK